MKLITTYTYVASQATQNYSSVRSKVSSDPVNGGVRKGYGTQAETNLSPCVQINV